MSEYRRKAAEEAAKAAAEAAKDDPNAQAGRDRGPGGKPGGAPGGTNTNVPAKTNDEKPEVPDAPAAPPAPDTTATAPPQIDTSQISFIWATSRVKLYRDDIQMSCDSLAYNDLDSLVRLYRDPLIFNEGNRQYSADSIYVVIKNKRAERARLMSDAFITTQEDTLCYDQIKSTEMMAYFDSTRTLQRFDALGGATALFFLTENDALATVNKVESKMLYALFDEGNLDKIYYFDNAKNDAYPIVQLPKDERYMKGFRWDPDRKPSGPKDITPFRPRVSQRTTYLARPHAEFKETNVYFPGHINKIYKDIALRDSMAVVKARQPKEKPADKAPADTVAAPIDTTLAPPALSAADDSLRVALDSLSAAPVLDTQAAEAPTEETPVVSEPKDEKPEQPADKPKQEEAKQDASKPEEPVLDPAAQKKEMERAAKEAEKARKAEEKRLKDAEKARIAAEKQAAKEAKWAEEDKKFQEKQAAKAQKQLEKERKAKLRALKKLEKKAAKERRIFERYLEKERKRAEKAATREAEKARKEAEKEAIPEQAPLSPDKPKSDRKSN